MTVEDGAQLSTNSGYQQWPVSEAVSAGNSDIERSNRDRSTVLLLLHVPEGVRRPFLFVRFPADQIQ